MSKKLARRRKCEWGKASKTGETALVKIMRKELTVHIKGTKKSLWFQQKEQKGNGSRYSLKGKQCHITQGPVGHIEIWTLL